MCMCDCENREFLASVNALNREQKAVISNLACYLKRTTIEVEPLLKELEVLKNNFKDISEISDSKLAIPLTYDMLVAKTYIWHNSAKRYRRVEKLFVNCDKERCVDIEGCVYREEDIIGRFFKYDFNW